MPISPYPSSTVVRRLKEISPRLYPEWDKRRGRWNIMFRLEGRVPQILHVVNERDGGYRPIDGRAYEHLRYIFWLNRQHGGNQKRILWDMLREEQYRREKTAQKEEDFIRDFSKDVAPLLRSMARGTAYSAYTKPIPRVQCCDFK